MTPESTDLIEVVGNRTNTAPHPRGILLSDPKDAAGWAMLAVVTDETRATPELRVYPTRGLEQLTTAADAFALQVISREVAEQKYADLFVLMREVLPKLARQAAPKLESGFGEDVTTMPFEAPVEEEPLTEPPPEVAEWRPLLREMTAELTAVTVAAFQRGRTLFRKLQREPMGRSTPTLPTGIPVVARDFVSRASAPRLIKSPDVHRIAPGHVAAELLRPTAPRPPRAVMRRRPKTQA